MVQLRRPFRRRGSRNRRRCRGCCTGRASTHRAVRRAAAAAGPAGPPASRPRPPAGRPVPAGLRTSAAAAAWTAPARCRRPGRRGGRAPGPAKARPMPRVPEVDSTTGAPGRSSPRSRAPSSMDDGGARLHAARAEPFELGPEAGVRAGQIGGDAGERGAAEQAEELPVAGGVHDGAWSPGGSRCLGRGSGGRCRVRRRARRTGTAPRTPRSPRSRGSAAAPHCPVWANITSGLPCAQCVLPQRLEGAVAQRHAGGEHARRSAPTRRARR